MALCCLRDKHIVAYALVDMTLCADFTETDKERG